MSVRHALLALLSEGPKYGLRLREEFEAGTGEVWPLNIGQVYTTLQRLERDGLIESEDDEHDSPQRRFRITAAGEHELAAWLRTPPDMSSPPRDELVIKLLVALHVPGTDVAGERVTMSPIFSPSSRASASTKTSRPMRSRINSATRHTTMPPELVPTSTTSCKSS